MSASISDHETSERRNEVMSRCVDAEDTGEGGDCPPKAISHYSSMNFGARIVVYSPSLCAKVLQNFDAAKDGSGRACCTKGRSR